jgi:hypothetical protein
MKYTAFCGGGRDFAVLLTQFSKSIFVEKINDMWSVGGGNTSILYIAQPMAKG